MEPPARRCLRSHGSTGSQPRSSLLYLLFGSTQGSKHVRDPRIQHPGTLRYVELSADQAASRLAGREEMEMIRRKHNACAAGAYKCGASPLQKSLCLADRVVSSSPGVPWASPDPSPHLPVPVGSSIELHLCVAVLRLSFGMAIVLRFVAMLQAVLILGALTAVNAGRPIATAEATDAAKIAALCTTAGLECAHGALQASLSSPADGVRRDASIHTINDLQRDFFLESALVQGGHLTLDANLRDAAPKRAFLTASAARLLPPLTSSSALDLITHFGVARHSQMATAIATAAHLCGSGALPGESMSCAASAEAMADFVSAELGPRVKVLSTSNVPASAPAAKAPVTITDVAKGSVAEGKKIVVCHAVSFPSAAYYCHRVTGTKVITAALKPAHAGDSDVIKAVGICHMDTSLWMSTHPAFRALNIPRGDEACHMLIDSDLVFVPTTTTDARRK